MSASIACSMAAGDWDGVTSIAVGQVLTQEQFDMISALMIGCNDGIRDARRYRWLREQFARGLETYLAESIASADQLDAYVDTRSLN